MLSYSPINTFFYKDMLDFIKSHSRELDTVTKLNQSLPVILVLASSPQPTTSLPELPSTSYLFIGLGDTNFLCIESIFQSNFSAVQARGG